MPSRTYSSSVRPLRPSKATSASQVASHASASISSRQFASDQLAGRRERTLAQHLFQICSHVGTSFSRLRAIFFGSSLPYKCLRFTDKLRGGLGIRRSARTAPLYVPSKNGSKMDTKNKF